MDNDHLRVPLSILGIGFGIALSACSCVCVCVTLPLYSLSQPITVLRSWQLSPLSSSLSPLALFYLLLLHPSSHLTRGSQKGRLSPRSCSHWESLHRCGTPSHTHKCKEQNTTCLLCLFLSVTVRLQPSVKPEAFAVGFWCTNTHTDTLRHTNTCILLSNPNVPSMFVITHSPDGTWSIGFSV